MFLLPQRLRRDLGLYNDDRHLPFLRELRRSPTADGKPDHVVEIGGLLLACGMLLKISGERHLQAIVSRPEKP
jgi:hypothetical protein